MPNDVRGASGSSSATPGMVRSHSTLDFVRQLIAQLVDVAGPHQQQEVTRPDESLQRFPRRLEITNVCRIANRVRKVRGIDSRRVLLTCAVHVEHEDLVSPIERSREVVHQGGESRVAVRLEYDDQAPMPQL